MAATLVCVFERNYRRFAEKSIIHLAKPISCRCCFFPSFYGPHRYFGSAIRCVPSPSGTSNRPSPTTHRVTREEHAATAHGRREGRQVHQVHLHLPSRPKSRNGRAGRLGSVAPGGRCVDRADGLGRCLVGQNADAQLGPGDFHQLHQQNEHRGQAHLCTHLCTNTLWTTGPSMDVPS